LVAYLVLVALACLAVLLSPMHRPRLKLLQLQMYMVQTVLSQHRRLKALFPYWVIRAPMSWSMKTELMFHTRLAGCQMKDTSFWWLKMVASFTLTLLRLRVLLLRLLLQLKRRHLMKRRLWLRRPWLRRLSPRRLSPRRLSLRL
jgi:hypothetical protein